MHLEMMDGGAVHRDVAPWLFASWLRKGMVGWRRTRHRGWRHCCSYVPFYSWWLTLFRNTHRHAHTTHNHTFCCKCPCTILVCWAFPPDLLNLASDSGTCYWQSWRAVYSFDLGGEKHCKGYQHGRGRQARIVSLVHYYTLSLKKVLPIST